MQSGVIDTTWSLDFLIQFLHKTTDASVLAEPQINIDDNQTGRIFVGQQVPTLENTIITAVADKPAGLLTKTWGDPGGDAPHQQLGDVALKVHTESSITVPGCRSSGGTYSTRAISRRTWR